MSENQMERESYEELPAGGVESAGESADVEALQAEVTQLRSQLADSQAASEARGHGGRRVAVALLVLLGCLLFAGANVASWLADVVLDTDAWVDTVAPLSRNEVIANALSSYVTEAVFDLVEADQIAQELLPARLTVLAGPLVSTVQDLVRDTVTQLIRSDQFNAVWVVLNRAAHGAIVGALRADGTLLSLKDGRLTVDLSSAVDFLQTSFGLEDLALFGEDWGTFVIFESYQVAAAQQALDLLDTVGILLPVLALIAFGVAWLISLWRRRTLLWIGVGTAITMALSLLVLLIAQPVVLGYIADPLVRLVGGEILGILLRSLIIQTILLGILGLLIAGGAWLAGPEPQAVKIRAAFRRE